MKSENLDFQVTSALRLTIPLLLANTVEVLMRFIDQFMLSRFDAYSPELLISAVIGGGIAAQAVMAPVVITLQYVNAMVAQAIGGGKPIKASLALSQAVFLSLICFPLPLLCIPFSNDIFLSFSHTPTLALLESQYFNILTAGNLIFFLRAALTSFFIGIGRSYTVMLTNLFGMLCNIPLNLVFIFGWGPVPAMGIQGAAAATVISGGIIVLLLIYIYFSPGITKIYRGIAAFRWNPKLFRDLIRFGLPAGIEGGCQVIFFEIFLLIMHSYNVYVASAVSIAITWDSLLYYPLLSFSLTTTSIVGYYIGAKQISSASRVVKIMIKLAIYTITPITLLFLFFPSYLATPFLKESENLSITLQYASPMLQLAGLYMFGEAVHQVFLGFLRGSGDTLWLMSVNILNRLLLVGMTLLFVKVWNVDPIISWWVFVFCTFLNGIVVWIRYLSGKWKTILSL